ncbi:MAG: transposase [Thermoanaerobaculales bacterium]|jgi:REP element-mobilizing transposase RayT|nr:transposase [Thermoanaerobaculales bacterium]
MPRADRVLLEDGHFHVYNRLGRGEHAFDDEDTAQFFIKTLRAVVRRDDLTVFAWCLMSNHFHIAVRMGGVPLSRSLKSLQQRTTIFVNRRRQQHGPLWQGRFKAKLVDRDAYMNGLLSYIHLNPVAAGLVSDPAEFRWSGHLDILGIRKDPIVDVDSVLRLFGTTRKTARSAYVKELNLTEEKVWIGEQPGSLPWWRLGRPSKGQDEDPEDSIRKRRKRESQGPEWRPELTGDEFVERGCKILGIATDDIRSRGRAQNLVFGRELLMVLGAERYNLKVNELAATLGQSPQGMSRALARGIIKRSNEASFRESLDLLDHQLSQETTNE